MTTVPFAIPNVAGHIASGRLARVGRRLFARPSVLYALLTALAFPILEMLLHGQASVQWAVDVLDGQLPILSALRADWLKYGPSLWDAHLTSGNSTLVQVPLPPFTPDFILSFVVPLFAAYFVAYAALIWIAGYGMHLFLRDSLGLRTAACVVGGVVYMFSFWPYIYGYAVPLLPFSLWLLDRWVRAKEHRWRWGVALVATGAFQLYAGLLQLAALIAVLQLAYLLATNWRSGRVRRLAAEWLGIWTVCGLLFAPVAITMLVYLPGSVRTIWNIQWLYPTAPLDALRSALSLFGSAIGAIPVTGWTSGTAQYSGTFFIGGIAVPLLYIALFRPRDARLKFLLAMLAALPVIYAADLMLMPLQGQLDFLKSFQLIRVSSLFPFALAANAAIGADALLSGQCRDFFRGRLRTAGLGALLVLLGAEAAASLINWANLPQAGQASSGWLLSAIAIGVGTVLGAALLVIATRPSRALVVAGPLLLIFLVGLVGESAIYSRGERYLHPGLSKYADYMTVDPGQAYIAKQSKGDPVRTLTIGFPANRTLNAGLYDVGGLEPIYPLTYHDLLGVLTAPHLNKNAADWRYFNWWGERAFPLGPELDYPVADLMGVRWIWTWNVDLQDSRLVSRFHYGAITVYENLAVFPRAFVVNQIKAFASEPALLSGLAAADDAQLRDTAFAVQGDGVPNLSGTSGPSASSDVKVSRYSPDRVDLWVQSSAPGLLILTDTYAPGWTATVCGSAAPIYRVDAAYRAVSVPKGTCTVTFKYRPWFTYGGFIAAGLTALGLIGFTVLMTWRDRGRRLAATEIGSTAVSAAAASPPYVSTGAPPRGPDPPT